MQSEFNVIDLMTIELKENTVKRGEVINKVIKRKRIKVVLMLTLKAKILFRFMNNDYSIMREMKDA